MAEDASSLIRNYGIKPLVRNPTGITSSSEIFPNTVSYLQRIYCKKPNFPNDSKYFQPRLIAAIRGINPSIFVSIGGWSEHNPLLSNCRMQGLPFERWIPIWRRHWRTLCPAVTSLLKPGIAGANWKSRQDRFCVYLSRSSLLYYNEPCPGFNPHTPTELLDNLSSLYYRSIQIYHKNSVYLKDIPVYTRYKTRLEQIVNR